MSWKTCTICTDNDWNVELGCYHSFCRDCLVSYLTLKIQDGESKLKCPNKDCEEIIANNDINLILTDCDDIVERWNRNITRNQEREELFRNRPDDGSEEPDVEVDVDVKKCPYCKYMVYKSEGCDAVKCPYCKHRFCFNCLELYRYMESVEDHQKKCEDFTDFDPIDKQNYSS